MKILPISNCGDCPHYRWIELNYSLECGLTCEQIRYKETGANKALMELFNQCPLQEYSLFDLLNELSTSCRQLEGEVKSLNAFLVHKGFAEEYIRWKGDD